MFLKKGWSFISWVPLKPIRACGWVSRGYVGHEELLDEVFGVFVQSRVDAVLAALDRFVEHAVVALGGGEGRVAHQHLEDQTAEGPVVDHAVVALVVDDLGGEVLGGAAEAVGLLDADWVRRGYFWRGRSR